MSCPLGHKCVTESEGEIKHCNWHVKLRGTDAQGNEIDEWGCAIAWLPILQLEHSNFERQTGAAVESLRNNIVKSIKNSTPRIEKSIDDKN